MQPTLANQVIDVNEQDFKAKVLDRSFEKPVIVDFWAPWCGPCRTLGPALEKLTAEYDGNLQLVKVNVDENPSVATDYGVQGIPAVKAFRNGAVVSEFVGAQPQPMVREFLRNLMPSPADKQAQQAQSLEQAGQVEAAEAMYRQTLEAEPHNGQALLGLGRVLLAQERYDEATAVLEQVPPLTPEADQAQPLLKLADLRREAASFEAEPALRERLVANPNDLEVRYELAMARAARGQYEAALDDLLELVRLNRKFRDDGARLAMLKIFDVLGSDDERVRGYQSRLASVLF